MTTPALAVEVRQAEGVVRYQSALTRAYGACLAPNDVSAHGIPACTPPITSACEFFSGTVKIESAFGADFPVVSIEFRRFDDSPGCVDGQYVVEIGVRTTADRQYGGDPICAGERCTFQDFVVRRSFTDPPNTLAFSLDGIQSMDVRDANFEILGVTIIAPDGLPIAAAGLSTGARLASSNLSVAYGACTSPEPEGPGYSCGLVPWTAACDFESSAIEWSVPIGTTVPTLHATLLDVAGSSAACNTGTYRAEATVRATMNACNFRPCTLVDTTVALPLAADGHHVDAVAGLDLGGLTGNFVGTQVLATRIVDPTGQMLAASGVSQARTLGSPSFKIAGAQLQLRATFPRPSEPLDPNEDAGASFTLTDHDGAVYAVTIPGSLWQLMPPIGERWEYKDPSGGLGGVVKASIKGIRKNGNYFGYDVRLRVEGADFSAADFPGLNLTIGIARASSSPLAGSAYAQRSRTCPVQGTKLSCR